MKFLILLSLFSLAALVASDGAQWGSRQPNDRLLEVRTYTKGSFPLKKVTMNVEYRGFTPITFIRAIDNSSGGNASILSGGVGSTNAVVRLKSGRGKKLNFTIEIYGR
ncbi:uncharacterized protein LOC129610366 [Condylostylus longicornis]|uniref:uncharacterized protein LOC129610366 n=1 Tax=Condylostylus longicornis TaxID=2530218 RepID=UPI00244DA961|nr:uncharacterized protein LOC129610366 [Condylostylus longicornis]